MKIALIGYGKMGKEIEKIAVSREHEIVARIDPLLNEDFNSQQFKCADIAIEFTTPDSALHNYKECFKHNIPVVSGTTGWFQNIVEAKEWCEKRGQTLFYASNFSIGVNLFFELNDTLAQLMNDFPQYEVSIAETHHTEKKDAPSGTAITLSEGIIKNLDRKTDWNLNQASSSQTIEIKAFREGDVPGIHIVKYQSLVDEIEIRHSAKSRLGFALGAVLAAEYTINKKGFLTMKNLLKDYFVT
ncbi:MAG: 4-hydroxy-tetrahydrodipicolinate reductase [Marinilabiliaceae bacterium]|nr:4-hydroxy-tetrahydrodipicolinate reductase [Marinilabiliaceae bacterium]